MPTLAGEILRKVVQQLASPRRNSADWRAMPAGRARDIDWPHRNGRALVQLLEHLPTGRLSGKVAATIIVTVDEEKLRRGAARHAPTRAQT